MDPFNLHERRPGSCRCSCWRSKPLFAEADYISFNCRRTPITEHLWMVRCSSRMKRHRPVWSTAQGRHRR